MGGRNRALLGSFGPAHGGLGGPGRQGEKVLASLAKWVADSEEPALNDIKCVRAEKKGVKRLTFEGLMFSAEVANLMGGVLRSPGGATWEMEPENGQGLYFEPDSRRAADFASFTNGSYRIDLLDFTNGVAGSYTFNLRGGAVTQAPAFLSPGPFTQPAPAPGELARRNADQRQHHPADPQPMAGFGGIPDVAGRRPDQSRS